MAASSSGDRRFSLANLIFALASSYGGADCSCCGMWYRSHVAPFHFGLVWARSFNRFSDRFGGLLGDPIQTRKIRRVNHLVYIRGYALPSRGPSASGTQALGGAQPRPAKARGGKENAR